MSEVWWSENQGHVPSVSSPRTRAYVRAYARICGGDHIPAGGILLDDGYMYPDRAVIKSLLLGGYAIFNGVADPAIQLTERGRRLLEETS